MRHIQRPSTKPRGKPFERGHDSRRNTSGVRHRPSTAALYEAASDEDLTRMWVSGLARAIGGDVRWASLICSYLDGKPLGREERGSPGEYHRIDLSEYSSDELRAFIKAVKPPEEEPQWDPMVSLEVATDEELTALWEAGLRRAIAGDVRWATLIVAYLDGKPLGREERGSPGDYHRIDLSEYSSDELRAFIKAVKPPEEEPQWDPMVSLELSEPPRAAP